MEHLSATATSIRDATVLADLRREEPALWQVTVLIARPPGEPPIREGEVEAVLFDAEGPLELLSQPTDDWVEAGGAAGTTANGGFLFQARDATPSRLTVLWGGDRATLEVVTGR